MASYGSATYGSDAWGGAFELGAARLLYIIRMAPRFRALADLLDARWSHIAGLLEHVRVGFDLDSAVGDQLDVIGRWVGRPREGMVDERYRRALRVQVQILSSRSSTTTMLAVFEAWIGDTATTYRNVAPAYVEIGGPVDPADEHLLRVFLQLAAPGGVVLSVVGTPTGGDGWLIVDSIAVPVTDPGVIDSIADPVTDARPIAYEV